MDKIAELRAEIEKIAELPTITMQNVQTLAMLHGAICALECVADGDAEGELSDILPALHSYRAEHCTETLTQLCVEIADLCAAVYATTTCDAEREIFHRILNK